MDTILSPFGFARSLPERERRELFVSNPGSASSSGDPEKKAERQRGRDRKNTIVREMADAYGEILKAAVPESTPQMSALIADTDLAERVGFDQDDAAREAARLLNIPMGSDGPWRSAVTSKITPWETQSIEREIRTRSEDYMRSTLADPTQACNVERELREQINRGTFLGEALERRVMLKVGAEERLLSQDDQRALETTFGELQKTADQINRGNVALLLSGTKESIASLTEKIEPQDLREKVAHILETNPTDGWAISIALNLEESIADPLQRLRMQQLLVETMNALTKSENFGATKRDESSRSWSEWRRKYIATLEERSTTLREHIETALEQRSIKFLQADNDRLKTFVTTLGIDPSQWDTGKSASTAPLAEEACFKRYGVSLSGVGKFFTDRTQAIEDAASDLDPRDTSTFADRAQSLGKLLADLEKENNCFDPSDAEHFLVEQRQEQEDTEQWAYRIGTRLNEALSTDQAQRAAITPLLKQIHGNEDPWQDLTLLRAHLGKYAATKGDKARLAALRKDFPQCITPSQFSETERDQLEAMLSLIAERRSSAIRSGTKLVDAYEKTRQSSPEMDAISRGQEETKLRIQSLLGTIIEDTKDTPVFHTLKLKHRLTQRVGVIEGNVIRASAAADMSAREPEESRRAQFEAEAKDCWAKAQTESQSLQSVADGIRETSKNILEEEIPSDRDGFYSYEDRRIHIRRSLDPAMRASVIKHEKGHAVLHQLRRSGLLPFLLISEEKELSDAGGKGDEHFWEMLESLSGYYQISRCEEKFRAAAVREYGQDAAAVEARTRDLRREFLLEEFEIHFAEWQESKTRPAPRTAEEQTERDLFAMKEAAHGSRKPNQTTDVPDDLGIELASASNPLIDPEDAEEGSEPEHVATSEQEGIPNIKQEIIDTQRMMKIITSFQSAYHDDPESQTFLSNIAPDVHICEGKLSDLEKRLYEKGGDPEADQKYTSDVRKLSGAVTILHDRVKKRDNNYMDISGRARKTKAPGFFDRIRFMSIRDIMKLYKDTVEDFKTIWGRNQERLLQDVGGVLNDALTKAGGKLPVVGNRYFAKLRGYHERRYAGAELDSVEKWKKSMERWDSHEILDTISHSGNLDQIRGAIEMLCDRGEMDWNDRGVWNTLRRISNFNMPFEACERDDVLRDIWLRRIVSDIWKDKELFYKWRTNNDSQTNSHKQKFIQTVDQFSNVNGGLSGSLERQLTLYSDWKDASDRAGHHLPFPDEVKPHLYEQIIEYSIKNGKMTMEQKMYYLVQGVASGLLSVERLRALAGQNGGIINYFPYIEYFYCKNNTLPEIKKIAASLKEKKTADNPNAEFKPGLKTTLWLHYKVAREEAVRARLSKGSARSSDSGVTMDHEDIPFFITQMDYKEMDNMAGIVSGKRQKVTPEGWKNAYVGFNSKFRVFANCALLEKQGLERLSRSDTRMLAQNLGAYIYMDNILTGTVQDNDSRPGLSEYQMSTRSPSGAKNTVTREYRDKMCDFIKNLYDSGILKDINWKALGVGPEELLPLYSTEYRRNLAKDDDKYHKLITQRIFPKFAVELERVILEHSDTFKDVLMNNENKFLNEGGSESLNRDTVQELVKEGNLN